MKRLLLLLLNGTLLAGMICAAELPGLRMESPVLGYVFDDTASAIRAVSGVPGAASLGNTVGLPALSEAYVHSGAKVAVVVTKDGKVALASWRIDGQVTAVETSLETLRMAAFSRSGGRVAASDGTTVEVWSTTDGRVVSRGTGLGEITAIAVNDAGVVLAAAGGRIVRLLDNDADTIAAGGEWTALAYASNGDSIAVDAARNELVRITPEGGRSVVAALPGPAAAIAVTEAGAYFAASPVWGLVSISAAGTSEPFACDCEPKGLEQMAGGALHLRGTSLVVDAESGLRVTTLPSLFGLGVNQ